MRLFDHHSGEHLNIGGARIYYEVTGNENKPALLFLHGGFGNIEDFNSILPGLCVFSPKPATDYAHAGHPL